MYTTPESLQRRTKGNPQMDNSLCTYMVEPQGTLYGYPCVESRNISIYGTQQDRRATFDKLVLQLQPAVCLQHSRHGREELMCCAHDGVWLAWSKVVDFFY